MDTYYRGIRIHESEPGIVALCGLSGVSGPYQKILDPGLDPRLVIDKALDLRNVKKVQGAHPGSAQDIKNRVEFYCTAVNHYL